MSQGLAAEKFFQSTAQRFDLLWHRKDWPDNEFCYVFEIQDGLQEQVCFCFDGIDEVTFSVGSLFTASFFPCPTAFEKFERLANGFLAGEMRLRYHFFRSVLEEPDGDSWKIIARYSGTKWLGFRSRISINQQQRS